jgi:uncharacterized protein YaaN involved in tellurite resistance
LHDLDLTRMIAIQISPQILLVQQNDYLLIDKITSSINNTIPAWKNQMVLALGLAHTKSAIKVQREVTEATNEILRKNADMLKQSSVEAAAESERSIVDIETLKYTNESLISTLTEIEQIHVEGKKNREAAEVELRVIEGQLKEKMTEIAQQI